LLLLWHVLCVVAVQNEYFYIAHWNFNSCITFLYNIFQLLQRFILGCSLWFSLVNVHISGCVCTLWNTDISCICETFPAVTVMISFLWCVTLCQIVDMYE
jgi:hypothetical protein